MRRVKRPNVVSRAGSLPVAAALLALLLPAAGLALAQQEPSQGQDVTLQWVEGPAPCQLGTVARLDLPEGYQFVGAEGTQLLMELMENPTSGQELGLAMPIPTDEEGPGWFVVFEYNPLGYVRDDEKNDLDADKIIASIRKSNDKANEIRRQNGWGEISVEGWAIPPYYDEQTHDLRWAIRGKGEGGESVNFSTRLLGRGGAMSADLVADVEGFRELLPAYDALLSGFTFSPGHTYAEYREGDRVAKYGLTALVAGGAGALAVKTGLLARFWKLIVVGFLGLIGALRRVLRGLFRRDESPMSRLQRSASGTTLAGASHTGPPPEPTETPSEPHD